MSPRPSSHRRYIHTPHYRRRLKILGAIQIGIVAVALVVIWRAV